MSEKSDFYFQSYEEWRHAITIRCDIKLTKDYALTRVAALRNLNDKHTIEFKSKYGEAYLEQIILWFERAAQS
ncbi:hypothetical protein C1E23_12750 [Pseudoalteromonas phenolica]|uniref:Uncharacterized protein n=1 Tax=Pseudoalteromonas phenolica TaxID=161398 RepID=A0A4Q7IKF0_9GAMM|nr:hypothetical protein [Pseudoalteromonas phenolica]RZQ52653.1 hypothetical protein C1E23_12750 [Pseudoalteromonas phenolica]